MLRCLWGIPNETIKLEFGYKLTVVYNKNIKSKITLKNPDVKKFNTKRITRQPIPFNFNKKKLIVDMLYKNNEYKIYMFTEVNYGKESFDFILFEQINGGLYPICSLMSTFSPNEYRGFVLDPSYNNRYIDLFVCGLDKTGGFIFFDDDTPDDQYIRSKPREDYERRS